MDNGLTWSIVAGLLLAFTVGATAGRDIFYRSECRVCKKGETAHHWTDNDHQFDGRGVLVRSYVATAIVAGLAAFVWGHQVSPTPPTDVPIEASCVRALGGPDSLDRLSTFAAAANECSTLFSWEAATIVTQNGNLESLGYACQQAESEGAESPFLCESYLDFCAAQVGEPTAEASTGGLANTYFSPTDDCRDVFRPIDAREDREAIPQVRIGERQTVLPEFLSDEELYAEES